MDLLALWCQRKELPNYNVYASYSNKFVKEIIGKTNGLILTDSNVHCEHM
jgi:hypothetical protein